MHTKKDKLTAYLFITPMMLGFVITMLGPLLYTLYMSFTNWPLLGKAQWVGGENYAKLASDPNFREVLGNTFWFAGGLVPLNIILALCLALFLYKPLKGIGFFRTIIFIPVMTSIVVWSILWRYMFATDSGFINQMLLWFGIKGPAWLYNQHLAMWVVIVTSALKNVGLNTVLFIAALQQVPASLYEAATLDGAKGVRLFRSITLPMISPTVFLTVILTIIGSLKVFSQVYVMTGGGPGNSTKVLVYYIWEQGFKLFNFGYASSMAMVLFLIILVFTVIQWSIRKRWVVNEE
jgi:multiple sugar transport system permease protein